MQFEVADFAFQDGPPEEIESLAKTIGTTVNDLANYDEDVATDERFDGPNWIADIGQRILEESNEENFTEEEDDEAVENIEVVPAISRKEAEKYIEKLKYFAITKSPDTVQHIMALYDHFMNEACIKQSLVTDYFPKI